MNNKGIRYKEMGKTRIADTRNIVISKCSEGGFTIAQQLEVKENPESDFKTSVFLKGAIHITEIDYLLNLRNLINMVLDKELEDD